MCPTCDLPLEAGTVGGQPLGAETPWIHSLVYQSAVIVVGAQAVGCAGEYCQSGPHGGTRCGHVSGPADPAGWRPQSAAPLASTSTSTSTSANRPRLGRFLRPSSRVPLGTPVSMPLHTSRQPPSGVIA
jgi:hypothetical protein